jgi:hypothetical protein
VSGVVFAPRRRGPGWPIWFGPAVALAVAAYAVSDGKPIVAAAFGLFAVVGTVTGRARSAVSVRTEGDTLLVRNPWSRYEVARGELAGFRVGPGRMGGSQQVWAVRRDGERVPLLAAGLVRNLDVLTANAAELERWRTGAGG